MNRRPLTQAEIAKWFARRADVALELVQSDWRNLRLKDILAQYRLADDDVDFGVVGTKAFPSFTETVSATLQRLPMLERMVKIFADFKNVKAIVSGGSMSYGLFYSVRNDPPSDIDFLIIMKNWPVCLNVLELKLRQTGRFENASIELLAGKIEDLFSRPEEEISQAVLSPKLAIIGADYVLSCHFMSEATADKYLMADTELIGDQSELVYELRRKANVIRNNFLGGEGFGDLPEIEMPNGYWSQVVAYAVFDNLFYAGQHQCVIFPCLNVELDKSSRIITQVMAFREKLLQRFCREKELNGRTGLYKIHLRHQAFNPRIVEPIWEEKI